MHITPFGLPDGGNEGVTTQLVDQVLLLSLPYLQIYFEKPNQPEKKENKPEVKKVRLLSLSLHPRAFSCAVFAREIT